MPGDKELVEAFLVGDGDEVAKAMHVEEVPEVALEYGPLPKNKYTVELENLIKELLKPGGDHISYEKDGDDLLFIFKEKAHNLTELLKYANLNHLVFDDEDFQNYINTIFSTFRCRPDMDPREARKTGLYDNLSDAEMCAINIYTGPDFYRTCNSFLRDPVSCYGNAITPRETLLTAVMMTSGLGKISDTKTVDYTFRGESKLPPEVVQQRIESMERQDLSLPPVTIESAFTSTAQGKPHGAFVEGFTEPSPGQKGATSGVVFSDLRAMNVSGLSQWGNIDGEEYLIPPTQMQWVAHRQTGQDQHIFIAKPVSTLTGLTAKHLEMPAPEIRSEGLISRIVSGIKFAWNAFVSFFSWNKSDQVPGDSTDVPSFRELEKNRDLQQGDEKPIDAPEVSPPDNKDDLASDILNRKGKRVTWSSSKVPSPPKTPPPSKVPSPPKKPPKKPPRRQ